MKGGLTLFTQRFVLFVRASEYPELTTLRNEVTPLASVVQSTDDWDAQQISLRDFVIDTMTRLSMWSDDKERLEMVSSASYKPEGYLL